MSVRVEHGDCLEVMPRLHEEGVQVDSVCCDPPYHLVSIVKRFGKDGSAPVKSDGATGVYGRAAAGFMGQTWDGGDIAFRPETWRLAFELLKPGGHMLVFGGTRTYHRLACAIEDAGFEIRDTIMWHYGTGFPKSHDVSKGIDRGAPRAGMFSEFAKHYEQQRHKTGLTHAAICGAGHFYDNHNHGGASVNWARGHNVPTRAQWRILQPLLSLADDWLALIERVETEREITGQHDGDMGGLGGERLGSVGGDQTAPATDAAKQWEGWGTALKPATEIICLARKPLSEKTVAANVLEHGTGALNIDGCRVGTFKNTTPPGTDRFNQANHEHGYRPNAYQGNGRDGEASADRRYAEKGSTDFAATPGPRGGSPAGRWPANCIHDGSEEVLQAFPRTGPGGSLTGAEPSSPFANVYGDMPDRAGGFEAYGDQGTAARFFYTAKADKADRLGSKHPTVKPVDLMAYLCRLITPPGGLVLDPFAGSGTTAMACLREGFDAIVIEKEARFVADIRRRLAHVEGADTPLFEGAPS
jgi:site-specific DNA-methyltransferase (adenine-specific)